MLASEIRLLWLYAKELWGATFELPEDSTVRQVKEQAWFDVLGDLDAGLVRRAMVAHGGHFAPTPQELRQTAISLGRLERGDRMRKSVDQALEECYRLIARLGYTHETEALQAAEEFDPALYAVLRAIGWQEVCAEENPSVFRGQFRQFYEGACTRLDRDQADPAPALVAAMPEQIER